LGALVPGLKAAAFERQAPQDLPPGFDQVKVSGLGRLEDEMPARVGQGKKEHVRGAVSREVIHDGEDRWGFGSDPLIDGWEKVDPVRRGAPRVGKGERPALSGVERPEHRALTPPAVIHFVPGAGRSGGEPPGELWADAGPLSSGQSTTLAGGGAG